PYRPGSRECQHRAPQCREGGADRVGHRAGGRSGSVNRGGDGPTAPGAVAVRVVLALSLAPAAGIAQITLSGTAAASLVVHQVNIGYGVEESSGLLLAGEGGVTFRSRVGLAIRAAGGSLSTSTAGAENRDIGEVGVEASVIPAPWLALRGSGAPPRAGEHADVPLHRAPWRPPRHAAVTQSFALS